MKKAHNKLTYEDALNIEAWWHQKASKNFLAFRQFMRGDSFLTGWFISDLSRRLQQFYVDLISHKKPVLVIQTPPQHGKSWAITDLIAFILGRHPELRVIFATFSDRLSKRCNNAIQRFMQNEKYRNVFPEVILPEKKDTKYSCNNEIIEFVGTEGYFRNTTVGGAVTGESLDLGAIDDPFKGRKQASSETFRDQVWDWFTNDFFSRASENSGLLVTMTRWHKDDLVGRMSENMDNVKILNYPAIALQDEVNRKEGEALFPELKSLKFLKERKKVLYAPHWSSLYDGSPVVEGGDMFKDKDWGWWEKLPPLKFTFIVVDTAQKVKTINDWTDFQLWGMGIDDNIYLLDHFHEKLESPDLRKEAVLFYNKHNVRRKKVGDPVLRGMFIEDKSSGSGLIQELKRKKVKVYAVQRNIDKVFRATEVIPEIESGKVYLNEEINDVGVITSEAREFPNGKFDDAIDTTMSAIELAFIDDSLLKSSLQAAMEA